MAKSYTIDYSSTKCPNCGLHFYLNPNKEPVTVEEVKEQIRIKDLSATQTS